MISGAREAFNMPQTMLQTPAVRQALTDERMRLMTGEIPPAEFAQRIEAAAAADRAAAADPDHVEIRHPVAGALLLATVGGAALLLDGEGQLAVGEHRAHRVRQLGVARRHRDRERERA